MGGIEKSLHRKMATMRQYLTPRKLSRLWWVLLIAVPFLVWKLLPSKPEPTSAVGCKSKIAQMVLPKKADRKKILGPLGDDAVHLEDVLFHYTASMTTNCYDLVHLGPPEDGGWEVCREKRYAMQAPCMVYSFGIGHDFRFEKSFESMFGCDVYAFDPSMGVTTHKYSEKGHFYNIGIDNEDGSVHNGRWKMRRLKTIMKDLGHEGKTIDYLKMDVEFSEWLALYDMLETGLINQVRQLGVEIHTPEMDIHTRPDHACTWSTKDTLAFMVRVLVDLRNVGFSLYYTRTNYRTSFKSDWSGHDRFCCHNLHFVNTKHPRNEWLPPN